MKEKTFMEKILYNSVKKAINDLYKKIGIEK